MDTRTIIVLDDEDAETPPEGYTSFHVNVLADEEVFRAYRVHAKTAEEAIAIAIAQGQKLLDATLISGGFESGIPDATIMDAREWRLDGLFAEGFQPDTAIWDQGEVKRFVSIEAGSNEYWMAFSDTLEEALKYFELTEGGWDPFMIVDLDTDERHMVGMKAYVVPPENV